MDCQEFLSTTWISLNSRNRKKHSERYSCLDKKNDGQISSHVLAAVSVDSENVSLISACGNFENCRNDHGFGSRLKKRRSNLKFTVDTCNASAQIRRREKDHVDLLIYEKA